jgi:hypothetical protein
VVILAVGGGFVKKGRLRQGGSLHARIFNAARSSLFSAAADVPYDSQALSSIIHKFHVGETESMNASGRRLGGREPIPAFPPYGTRAMNNAGWTEKADGSGKFQGLNMDKKNFTPRFIQRGD